MVSVWYLLSSVVPVLWATPATAKATLLVTSANLPSPDALSTTPFLHATPRASAWWARAPARQPMASAKGPRAAALGCSTRAKPTNGNIRASLLLQRARDRAASPCAYSVPGRLQAGQLYRCGLNPERPERFYHVHTTRPLRRPENGQQNKGVRPRGANAKGIYPLHVEKITKRKKKSITHPNHRTL